MLYSTKSRLLSFSVPLPLTILITPLHRPNAYVKDGEFCAMLRFQEWGGDEDSLPLVIVCPQHIHHLCHQHPSALAISCFEWSSACSENLSNMGSLPSSSVVSARLLDTAKSQTFVSIALESINNSPPPSWVNLFFSFQYFWVILLPYPLCPGQRPSPCESYMWGQVF